MWDFMYIRCHARYYSTLRTSVRGKCGVFKVTVNNAMKGAEYLCRYKELLVLSEE